MSFASYLLVRVGPFLKELSQPQKKKRADEAGRQRLTLLFSDRNEHEIEPLFSALTKSFEAIGFRRSFQSDNGVAGYCYSGLGT